MLVTCTVTVVNSICPTLGDVNSFILVIPLFGQMIVKGMGLQGIHKENQVANKIKLVRIGNPSPVLLLHSVPKYQLPV